MAKTKKQMACIKVFRDKDLMNYYELDNIIDWMVDEEGWCVCVIAQKWMALS
jgi:hypothetical protein